MNDAEINIQTRKVGHVRAKLSRLLCSSPRFFLFSCLTVRNLGIIFYTIHNLQSLFFSGFFTSFVLHITDAHRDRIQLCICVEMRPQTNPTGFSKNYHIRNMKHGQRTNESKRSRSKGMKKNKTKWTSLRVITKKGLIIIKDIP